jgi:hypothetical protein
MRYLKYFEAIGARTIKVEVRELVGPSRKINGEEFNYTLKINGDLFYYHTFPFVKDQDNFEIISSKDNIITVEIDKDTFEKNKGTVNRNYKL